MLEVIKKLLGFGDGGRNGASGNPEIIPCSEANAHLLEYLDEELDPETAEAVRRHLEACPECYPRARFEEEFLKSIRRIKAQEEPGPELRDRILEVLARESEAE